jgi:hypothetical protein
MRDSSNRLEGLKMKLFHYTSIHHLSRILEQGILWKGDIPITRTGSYGSEGHAVWLTLCERASSDEHGLKNPICDKSEIRFTIQLDEDDPRLFKWSDYAKRRGVARNFYRDLDDVGGGLSDTWWLYVGQIPVNECCISKKVNGQYEDLAPSELMCESNEQNSMQV